MINFLNGHGVEVKICYKAYIQTEFNMTNDPYTDQFVHKEEVDLEKAYFYYGGKEYVEVKEEPKQDKQQEKDNKQYNFNLML